MQSEPGIDMRIFIVGVPRSGTTLVQSLLAAHGKTTSFTESHFFSRHFAFLPLLSRPILTKYPGPRLREFFSENDERPPKAAGWFDAKGRRAFLPFLTRPATRQFFRVLDELTLRRDRSIWVEKTPKHLRYIPLIETVSERRTCFIHVIREGLEVVASLHGASQSWERPYDLDACVRRWNRDVGFSLKRITATNDHFVFYEDLTSQPEETLRQLLAALGVGWEPDILERYGRASDRLITRREAWKEGVGRSIRRSRTSDRALTPEQRDRVMRALRHGLYDRLRERAGRPSSETSAHG